MSECRLRVAPDALAAGRAEVTGDDHHYLFRVRRLTRGDAVTVFDGAGHQAPAQVASISAHTATLTIGPAVAAPPPAGPEVCVLLPLIKGERMDLCVEKLVELGVRRIALVRTERCVVKLDGERARRRCERLAARAEAAARQCRSVWAPQVAPVSDLADALADADAELRLVCSPAHTARPLPEALPDRAPASIAVLVGPEGGLTEAELAAAVGAGFAPVGLGPRILRAETAPIAAAAALGFRFGKAGSLP